MHDSAFNHMYDFKMKYLGKDFSGKVVDVGSRDINGSFKSLFEKCDYLGIDIVPGDNVDLVLKNQYDWKEIESNSVDVVISGSTLEHIEDDRAVMHEIARILKPKGLTCIIVPSKGHKHCLPDYRRYQIDDMRMLAESANLRQIECRISFVSYWGDCVLVAQKNG